MEKKTAIKINKKKLSDYLNKYPAPVCEFCGNRDWSIQDDLICINVVKEETLELTGRSYPLKVLICSHCGNTKFINVLAANIGEFITTDVEEN